MAFASGWPELLSMAAAAARSPEERSWNTTEGFPSVRVPVLSIRTTAISLVVWMASAFLIRRPRFEASPVPATRAMGVASPRAQGQAMTIVATKTKTLKETALSVSRTQGIRSLKEDTTG